MALSTRHQPDIVASLARDYEILDAEDVFAFLKRYPELPPLLPEIREAIRRFFGDDQVRLEISRDPEWEDEEPRLFLNIRTHLGPQEAFMRLKRFDHEWWLAQRAGIDVPMIVSMHLI